LRRELRPHVKRRRRIRRDDRDSRDIEYRTKRYGARLRTSMKLLHEPERRESVHRPAVTDVIDISRLRERVRYRHNGCRPTSRLARHQPMMRTPCRMEFSPQDRKSTRLNSSHQIISYAVFCLNKK